MVKWKVFCVKILKNTRFIVNHCHPKTTISCNCHAFLTTRHKNFPAMLRDAREKPPWNKNFLPVCQRWKMFLFALDRIERAVGGNFVYIAEGFFLPAQGNRFAGKSPKYQPSLGLRQRRMEEAPPPKPLYRTREQRIPAGQGEISCRNWKSWHGACWLLRHSTAERPTEALHRTARFYIGEEKGGPARGRAIDRPAKKSCRMAGHRGRGVQPIL